MIRCCKCSREYPSLKVWNIDKKGVVFALCNECEERVNKDPKWQFTITDFGYREKDVKNGKLA